MSDVGHLFMSLLTILCLLWRNVCLGLLSIFLIAFLVIDIFSRTRGHPEQTLFPIPLGIIYVWTNRM